MTQKKTKYIDIEALKRFILANGFMYANTLDTFPAADVEPVIHCKDCESFILHPNDDYSPNAGLCTKNSHHCDFSTCEACRFTTDFCSYGKRKDENDAKTHTR